MTDKLHCPWCGTKLVQIQDMDFYYCGNLCCQLAESLKAPASIWRALIDGKKARDVLKEIVANPHGAACHNYRRARRVLEEIGEITSITKGKDK